jgi:hypothetical protein
MEGARRLLAVASNLREHWHAPATAASSLSHAPYACSPFPLRPVQSAADQITANYHSLMAGEGPLPANLVDRTAGY